VVEALKTHEHILVAKGASETLARQIEELILGHVARILPGLASRLAPRTVIGEVTSTYGDEATDEAVEEMVHVIARALMDSENVEDVFAEDNVIRRDIARASRDVLLTPTYHEDADDDEPGAGAVSVRLATLGYVARAVAACADLETLRDALERAAEASGSEFAEYDPAKCEATFFLQDAEPDARLELEESVADELAELVELGFVDLPTIERQITLRRALPPEEYTALKPRIELAASRTLRRAGCGATWKRVGADVIAVILTPLAEEDAAGVEERMDAFAAELARLTDGAGPATEQPRPRETSAAAKAPENGAAVQLAPKKTPTAKKVAAPKPAATKSTAKRASPVKKAATKPPASKKASSTPTKKPAGRRAPSKG
jgi:hypothetical protein